MGRQIITEKDLEAIDALQTADFGVGDEPQPAAQLRPRLDRYQDKLLKYIPAEVIALWVLMNSNLTAAEKNGTGLEWVVFGVCCVGTYFYLQRINNVSNQKQLTLSVLCFVVWVFAIGGPFTGLRWYEPWIAGLVMPAFTFFVPMVKL